MPLNLVRGEDIPIPEVVKPAILEAKKLVENGLLYIRYGDDKTERRCRDMRDSGRQP